MKYAFVRDGFVLDVESRNIPLEQLYHSDLIQNFIQCGDDVQPGYTYLNGVFTAPETETETENSLEEENQNMKQALGLLGVTE